MQSLCITSVLHDLKVVSTLYEVETSLRRSIGVGLDGVRLTKKEPGDDNRSRLAPSVFFNGGLVTR